MARIEFLESEFNEHQGAASSTVTKLHELWDTLTDYWNTHKDKETTDIAWRAGERMVNELGNYGHGIDGIWAMDKMAVTAQKAAVVPVQLLFGTEEYFTNENGTSSRSEFLDEIPEGAILCEPVILDGGGSVSDQYYLPPWVRYVASLNDFIVSPVMSLGSSDYAVDSSVLDDKTGTITFSSDYKDIMWCPYFLQKSITDIIDPFGSAVGYECRKEGRFETSAFYDVRALTYALVNGPTSYNIELGFSVFNLWPYTPFKCQVTAITGSTSIELRNVDDQYDTVTLTNSTGLPFRTRTEDGWVDIAELDILEANRAITEACHIETWNSDEDLFVNLGFTSISGRHVIIAVFDSDLPLAAAWDGWLADSTPSGSTIPALAGYAIDQAKTADHAERAKNSGTSLYFIALLDTQLDILSVKTSYGFTMNKVDGEVLTSFRSLDSPSMEIDTTFGLYPPKLLSNIVTTYKALTGVDVLDINTSYAMTLSAPTALLSATSY